MTVIATIWPLSVLQVTIAGTGFILASERKRYGLISSPAHMRISTTLKRLPFAFPLCFQLLACSDSTGSKGTPVSVAFRAEQQSAAALGESVASAAISSTGSAVLAISRGSDNVVITRAQVVLRNLKLQPIGGTCAGEAVVGDDSGNDATDDDDDGCPTIFVGPYLVDIPLTGGETPRLTVNIPEGTYRSVQLRLHKVSDNSEAERTFRQQHPELVGSSVLIAGTFNGQPFTFTSDITAVSKLDLPDPLVVGAGDESITIAIDVAGWFTRIGGTGLLSPVTSRSLIESNIRATFRAFRDRNRDGRED